MDNCPSIAGVLRGFYFSAMQLKNCVGAMENDTDTDVLQILVDHGHLTFSATETFSGIYGKRKDR